MKKHNHSARCEHLLGHLSDYLDGELQTELCNILEEHLQNCDNCRVVVNTMRKTIELYHQTAEPAGLPEAVRERLFYRLHIEDYLNH